MCGKPTVGRMQSQKAIPRPPAPAPWGGEGRLLLTYLRAQRRRVALLGVLLLASIALQLLSPQVVKGFIDSAPHGAADSVLARGALLFLAIALVQQAASVGATYLSENIGWAATNGVRADLL